MSKDKETGWSTGGDLEMDTYGGRDLSQVPLEARFDYPREWNSDDIFVPPARITDVKDQVADVLEGENQ
ncbi:hypothetical protein COU74_02370 [Candidatus Peregrinibacteria bacterium CG10_big_fil_rev_8_21_14_0_10_36_19]|nr:MAG: hypothetical protein COU74_02370 [Candidatus Peregrinibacteria bacterium CG10_big_fil_rev_8_21_14_0_10_36_19]